jgi:hypothetical protein
MPDTGKEEIIELTEVIEEGPLFSKKGKEEPSFASSPAPPVIGFRQEEIKPPAEDFPPKGTSGDSPGPSAVDYEAEIRVLQEKWNARVEAWFSKEGTQILERIARESFPRIAEKALRAEIEKLKTEIEEQE